MAKWLPPLWMFGRMGNANKNQGFITLGAN
jgi:hypothetical protein